MLFVLSVIGISFSLWSAPLAIDRPWPGISDPLIMSTKLVRKFNELPLKGEIKDKRKYWSGDYWALKRGSINYRWYAKEKVGFKLRSPTLQEALRMSVAELADLSPSEKYDLLLGRYDYPLKSQVEKVANPQAQIWEGICHGWAPASMNHIEPRPKLLRNKNGLEVPFGSTDIKALLSYYYAYIHQVRNTHQVGRRCTENDCPDDLNAGAFHLLLANRIGREGIGFIADVQRSTEVWNNPLYAYVSVVLKDNLQRNSDMAPQTMKVIRLKTDIYIVDGEENTWQPANETRHHLIKKLEYEYDLELDSLGNIIGGEWRSKARPDFLWIKERAVNFVGILNRLGELLNE